MISYCPIISSLRFLRASLIVGVVCSCSTSSPSTRAQLADGTISYPFIADTKPIGRAKQQQPFIIKSAVSGAEYSVEIPDDAGRYDIEIPLAELTPKSSTGLAGTHSRGDTNPLNAGTTDKELVAALPALKNAKPNETALLDAAFGVGSPEGPVQSPSYSLGISRVNQYFKERNFELALIELNNLLSFYPNSPKLLKMKGTLLVKTGNRDLAMRSWQRALDLSPNDQSLQKSITRLNERIMAERNARSTTPQTELNTPGAPITPMQDLLEEKTSH